MSRMRVLVHLEHDIPAFSASRDQLEQLRRALPFHDFVVCRDRTEFLHNLPAAEVAIIWVFLAEWYERASRLLLVLTPAAGRELVARDPRGQVPVTHGTFHGRIMAESLLSMIGFVNRRFGRAQHAQRRHAWECDGYSTTRRLAIQTVLLVGYGNIGRYCGRLLKAVGMTLHVVKRDIHVGTDGADRVFMADHLLEAVKSADHVVCVLPGDTGTDGLIGEAVFARMKPTAAVYNLGRANAIDVRALHEALCTGRIAAAFLDVLPQEPLPPDSVLWSTPDLFITPHVSSITEDYLDLYFEEIVESIKGLSKDGRTPLRRQ